jgi:hypothetical protein
MPRLEYCTEPYSKGHHDWACIRDVYDRHLGDRCRNCDEREPCDQYHCRSVDCHRGPFQVHHFHEDICCHCGMCRRPGQKRDTP